MLTDGQLPAIADRPVGRGAAEEIGAFRLAEQWADRLSAARARCRQIDGRAKGSRRPAGRPLSNEDRQALRRAGAEDARRSRARQGLPERIEDPVTAAALAALLRDRPRPARDSRSPSACSLSRYASYLFGPGVPGRQ